MLLLNTYPIRGFFGDFADVHAPFQPGEVYVVRYMTIPTEVTVSGRSKDVVSTFMGDMSVEEFNSRVLFSLGRRSRFLGLWMPWVRVDMKRVMRFELPPNLGTDDRFWRGEVTYES